MISISYKKPQRISSTFMIPIYCKMIDGQILIKIESQGNETDEEFEDFNMRLIDELRDVHGVNDVSFNTSYEKAPDGTRAGELVTMGEMVMTFLTTGGVTTSLDLLKTWVGSRKKKIKIDTKNGVLEADNLSKEELDKILNLLQDKKL
jgi:hypothetical protein